MRLKYMFETIELDGQIVAIPVGEKADEFQGVIKLNETAAYIFDRLKEDTTKEAIIQALEEEYDIPVETIANDVEYYIAMFTEKGLLVE